MLSNDLYGEIFTHIKDPTTIRNYVTCNKKLASIGKKHKENKIQQLLIPQVINVQDSLIEKYSILPNQKKHGLYQRFNDLTNLRCECNYKYGKLHGLYQKWSWNNMLDEQCNYINGKKEGLESIWHDSVLYQRAFYINGLLDGKLKKWNNEGKLSEEISYTNGIKHGLSRRWTYQGILSEEAHYVNGKRFDFEVRDGDGNIYLQIRYTSPSDYKYLSWHRKQVYYRANNTESRDEVLMCQRNYKNNVLHGIYKQWHPNGQLRKRVKYVNGLKQGLSENWASNGVKIQEINYVDDIKQGWTHKWNESGIATWDQFFVNGRVTYS